MANYKYFSTGTYSGEYARKIAEMRDRAPIPDRAATQQALDYILSGEFDTANILELSALLWWRSHPDNRELVVDAIAGFFDSENRLIRGTFRHLNEIARNMGVLLW